MLKKSIFLIALAAGNRISEIAATVRNGIGHINRESRVRLPVAPGFLFKNQRQGRNPPAIEIAPLGGDSHELCPVNTLARYLDLTKEKRGPLFLNSKTGKPLHKSTISKLLCEVFFFY